MLGWLDLSGHSDTKRHVVQRASLPRTVRGRRRTTEPGVRPPRSLTATGTLYQALGVAPDATDDEVRQAYLRLAMRHHPDRWSDAGAEERGQAAARMLELNAAWEVLGDRARRIAYDRSLLATGATSTADDPFAHLVRRNRTVDGVEQGDDAEVLAPAFARALPVLVVLGVLAAIFVFTAYAGGRAPEPDGQQSVRTAEEIPPGTCVTLPPSGAVETVECGTPSDGTVARIVDWPQPCPVPLLAVPVPERRESLCLRG